MSTRASPSGGRVRQAVARPFLKWPGGKRQLLEAFEPLFPASFGRYFEPFVGSGAVFFRLRGTGRLSGSAHSPLLSDHNAELINAYRVVRDEVDALVGLLAEYAARHSPETFYAVRALDRNGHTLGDVERAARTIYLNKTCYNGLYRDNSRGEFNAPLGRYARPSILQEGVLRAASAALQGVALEQRDYAALVDEAGAGDFFYFDPPYHPLSRTANFTAYTAGAFGPDDQRRLADVYDSLARRGCHCMLSNSDTTFIRELYAGYRIETIQATRAINSKAAGRGPISEVVILNY
jgi:DNA adenine methylase